jgi:hypothetical protein
MAVTVKIEDKKKAAKAKKTDATPEALGGSFDDYTLQKQKQMGLQALGIWAGIMVVICGLWFLPTPYQGITMPIGQGLLAWWLISAFGYLFIGPMMVVRRLRVAGPEAEINDKTQPRLKALLQKGSGLLDVDEPESYIEDEGSPRVYGLPRVLVFRKAAFDLLTPDEINCLAVRCLVHQRQGHTRRLAMMLLFESTPPPVRLLAWPVRIYHALLKAMWQQLALTEADRLSLLLIKNHKLLISAILKEYAANDENMQALKVEAQDVTNWINQAGHIGMEGKEISTQYKLGRAIHEDPTFEERILTLQKWADSPEFKTAVQKLSESRKK